MYGRYPMPLRSDAYTMNYFGKLYILKLLTTYINKQKEFYDRSNKVGYTRSTI